MSIVEQDSDHTKSRLKLGWGIAVSSPCLGNSVACPVPGAGQAHARTLCAAQVPFRGAALAPLLILGWYSWSSLTRVSPSLGRLGLAQISSLMRTVLTVASRVVSVSLVPSEPWEACLFLNQAGLFMAASSCHPARLLQSSRWGGRRRSKRTACLF